MLKCTFLLFSIHTYLYYFLLQSWETGNVCVVLTCWRVIMACPAHTQSLGDLCSGVHSECML